MELQKSYTAHVSFKTDGMTPLEATWKHLEMIVLSQVSQKEKDKYHTLSLISRV